MSRLSPIAAWCHLCKQAAEELAKKGISVELIDLRTIKPLDIATIAESVQKNTCLRSCRRRTYFCRDLRRSGLSDHGTLL